MSAVQLICQPQSSHIFILCKRGGIDVLIGVGKREYHKAPELVMRSSLCHYFADWKDLNQVLTPMVKEVDDARMCGHPCIAEERSL